MDETEYLQNQLESIVRYSYELSPENHLLFKKIPLVKQQNILNFLNTQCPIPAIAFFLTNHAAPNPYCPCCREEEHRHFNEDFGQTFGPHPFLHLIRLDIKKKVLEFMCDLPFLQYEEEFRGETNSFSYFMRAYDRMYNPLKYKLRRKFNKENTLQKEVFCLCGNNHAYFLSELETNFEIQLQKR